MDSFKRKVEYEQEQFRMRSRQDGLMDEDMYNHNYLGINDMLQKSQAMNAQQYGMMNMTPQKNSLSGPSLDEKNTNYYQEYCRLFIANLVLTSQMKELVAEKNELIVRLSKLEQQQGEIALKSPRSPRSFSSDSKMKKNRIRRKACEIDKHYICQVEKCQKSYGSEGSLTQHIRNKHPELANDPEFRMLMLKKDGSLKKRKNHGSDSEKEEDR